MAMIVIIYDICNDLYCKLATGRILMVVFKFRLKPVCLLFKVVVIVDAGGRQPWSDAIDLDATPLMMEIMFMLEDGERKHKKERPYHITYFELHVMLILLCILYCLVHG